MIEKAQLDEVSLVSSARYRARKVVGVRSVISEDEVILISRKVAAGHMTHAQGEAEIYRRSQPAPVSRPAYSGRRLTASEKARLDAEIDKALLDAEINAVLRASRI